MGSRFELARFCALGRLLWGASGGTPASPLALRNANPLSCLLEGVTSSSETRGADFLGVVNAETAADDDTSTVDTRRALPSLNPWYPLLTNIRCVSASLKLEGL